MVTHLECHHFAQISLRMVSRRPIWKSFAHSSYLVHIRVLFSMLYSEVVRKAHSIRTVMFSIMLVWTMVDSARSMSGCPSLHLVHS